MWFSRGVVYLVLFLAGLFVPLSGVVAGYPLMWKFGMLFSVLLFLPFWYGIRDLVMDRLDLRNSILIVGGIAYLYEILSIMYGFPYGKFDYGEMMGGLKLFGMVPIVLPIIYVAMVLSAMYVLRSLKGWARIFGVGVLLMLVDMVMDPGLTVNGVWYWYDSWIGVNLYNVPVQNFFGWFVTGSLSAWVVSKVVREDFWEQEKLNTSRSFWVWISPLSLSLVYWGGVAVQNGYWISVFACMGLLEFFGRKYFRINNRL